ncbi:MAG TPA: OmpA family protein [Pseudonocardia sp.]
MTPPRSIAGVLVAAVAAVTLLAGCSTPAPAGDDALAVVVGGHANSPAPAALGTVAEAIDAAVHGQAAAAVVVNAGTPTVASQGALGLNCRNGASCDQAVQQNTALLTGTVAQARADTPENDLLGAIALGARTLADHHGARTLAVIDSGLQTVAPLRFQDPGVLAADPGEVADYLERGRELPELAGATVIFSGIGDTVAPQAPLPSAARANLAAIWEAVARRAGAATVRFVQAPLTGAPSTGLPPVTAVPVGVPAAFEGATLDLPETVLPFERDTAVLKDPAAARAVLTGLADRISARRTPVLLTGATANVGPLDGQRALGKARAEAIRALLVGQLGVPASLVATVGVGSAWQGYVHDHDAAGQLLPGPAAQNRRVIVAPRQP